MHGGDTMRGPKRDEDICIGEEVKIAVNRSFERFKNDDTTQDMEFPSSLSATERAYIHRLAQNAGIKSKSKGKGINRCITIRKVFGNIPTDLPANFQLNRYSRQQIASLLQRYPLTTKERQERLPRLERSQPIDVTRELYKTTTGRLNNGVPQVPQRRGESEFATFRESLPVFSRCREILSTLNNHQVVLIVGETGSGKTTQDTEGSQFATFRESLPVFSRCREILSTLNNHQLVLIVGETGSGKTTQIPQMILDDCNARNRACRIICTQPRRIAALSVAERVAAERGEKIGQTVGYQIRLESKVSPKTLLTFCTNGVLLRTLMGGSNALSTITHVIIDEIHERDRFSDFLLVCIRDQLRKFTGLKVILMSATININLFVNYFNGCPVVSIPGTLFDVKEFFLEDVLKLTNYTNDKMEKYNASLTKLEREKEQLNGWCHQQLAASDQSLSRTANRQLAIDGRGDNSPIDQGFSEQMYVDMDTELGEEKEELELWVLREMDQLLAEVWMSGDEGIFTQILHLIYEENVSVDYQHSETGVTPLMVAAGRGFTNIVEQFLNLGANLNVKVTNDWTALDWAKNFNQNDTVELLEAHIVSIEQSVGADEALCAAALPEDTPLLTAYQHSFDDDNIDTSLITGLIHKIHFTQPEGAILVFVSGYGDIVSLRTCIHEDERFEGARYVIFTLHSSMQSNDQRKVFKPLPPGVRKIILSTNIAETSITINDVVYVIDAGKVKENTYDAMTSVVTLKCNWISKSSAMQRKGRAGRCQPGVCYHMFSKTRYQSLLEYPTPELLRHPLQELCLHTKLLAPALTSVAEFLAKAPEAPAFLITRNAINLLKQIDAFDNWEDLTELGHHLADLPLEPQLGKMVLYSVVLKCLDPILTIVCTIAYKDPFLLPEQPSHKRAALAARKKFSADTFSDHMTFLRVFQAWQKARTEGWEKGFCVKNFLSSACMEMIVGMRTQLLGQLRASGFVRARGVGDIRDLNTNSDNWAVVKAAITAGIYPNLLQADRKKGVLITQRESQVRFHQTSVLAPSPSGHPAQVYKRVIKAIPSDWIVYGEMSRYHRLAHVRCCTVITPITVAIFAGPSKLPLEALKDAETGASEQELAPYLADAGSDSDSEDRSDEFKTSLKLDDWITFKVDPEAANLGLQLRHKWNSLFLRRMRAPSKRWSQVDEAVLSAVINVISNEEQALGLQQPAGIGQRPRPMSADCIMSDTGQGRGTYDYNTYYSEGRGGQSPPKRSSPRYFNRGPVVPPPNMYQPRGPSGAYPHPQLTYSDESVPIDSSQQSRYFVMRCNNDKHLDLCVNTSAWSTTPSTQYKLTKAFKDGKNVYLIFAIHNSPHLHGYAIMTSLPGQQKAPEFNAPAFTLQWIKRGLVPYQSIQNLHNPWADNRSIQASRDGQEIEPHVGDLLLKLWDHPSSHRDLSPSSPSPTSEVSSKEDLSSPSPLIEEEGTEEKPQHARYTSDTRRVIHSPSPMTSAFSPLFVPIIPPAQQVSPVLFLHGTSPGTARHTLVTRPRHTFNMAAATFHPQQFHPAKPN